MSKVIDIGKARRFFRKREDFPLPSSLLAAAEVFGFDLSRPFTQFYLRRSRHGACVYVKAGPLTVNFSHVVKFYPPSFADARRWVKLISPVYGWDLVEIKGRRHFPSPEGRGSGTLAHHRTESANGTLAQNKVRD